MIREKLTDGCCRLVPDASLTPERAAAAINDLRTRFGFDRFYLSFDYCADRESVTAFRLRTDRAVSALRKNLPRTVRLIPMAALQLSPALSQNAELERLRLADSGYLPLALPLISYADWIDTELNRLLYKRHLSPLFLSFELCTVLYPPDVIEKLTRIGNAAFQFGYKSLCDPAVCKIISTLLRRGNPVLLGTSANTPEKVNAFDLAYYRECAFRHLKSADYRSLLEQSRALPSV